MLPCLSPTTTSRKPMKLINSLLDYTQPWELPDVYLFTGNPIVRLDGALVMGRGAARQVRDTFPGIDYAFGKLISSKYRDNDHVLFLPCGEPFSPRQIIGWYKVKHHWRNEAAPGLIALSAQFLGELAETSPGHTFHMNFPGIGNGRLRVDDVLPLLEDLPDNVLIYKC